MIKTMNLFSFPLIARDCSEPNVCLNLVTEDPVTTMSAF